MFCKGDGKYERVYLWEGGQICGYIYYDFRIDREK